MISADNVARAAPGTPRAAEKIKRGSMIRFSRFAPKEIFTGVTVSRIPRKAENPMRDIKDGKKANERIKRYGLAYWRAGAPSFSTTDKTFSGLRKMRGVPIKAIKQPIKRAWQTASWRPSWSPLAFSFETNVAVTSDLSM